MPAYTIDPTDELMPTDDKAAMYAAAEVRALKGRINDLVADWDPLVTAGRAKATVLGVEAYQQGFSGGFAPIPVQRYIARALINANAGLQSDAAMNASSWYMIANLPSGKYTQPAYRRVVYNEATDTKCAYAAQTTGNSVTSLTRAGVVVTVNTASAHGRKVGERVSVSGANPSTYAVQDAEITSVPTTTSFTYNAYSTPATSPATGVGTVYIHTPIFAEVGASRGDGSSKVNWVPWYGTRPLEVSAAWPTAYRAAGSAAGWVYVAEANSCMYVTDSDVQNIETPTWQVAEVLESIGNLSSPLAYTFAAGRYSETAEFGLAVSTMYNQLHALGVVPKTTRVVLVCKTADLGWTPGQELEVNPAVTGVVVSSGRLYAHVTTGTAIGILNKATGAAGNITPASWKLKLYFDRGYE